MNGIANRCTTISMKNQKKQMELWITKNIFLKFILSLKISNYIYIG